MTNPAAPQERIEDFVQKYISDHPEVFLVELKITPGNKITVLLDADQGMTIEKCTLVNRALYKFIEESDVYPDGNFSLEVSSPGVDKPLKLHRQYVKNIGRKLEVETEDGNKIEGTLKEVTENEIVIEQQEGKGKKMITKMTTILINQIKHAVVLITF